jgi:hypothetical protein
LDLTVEAELKSVKGLLNTIAALAIAGGLLWQFWLKEQVAFARAGTAYGAKQVCSCRHIGGRPLESCKGDFTADVSLFRFKEEGDSVRVSVMNGLISAEAKYEEGLGCALVKG